MNKLGVIFTRLFNVVLHSGLIPEEWCLGIVVPIYKKMVMKETQIIIEALVC